MDAPTVDSQQEQDNAVAIAFIRGESDFLDAVISGQHSVVDGMLGRAATNVNVANLQGLTALHVAAMTDDAPLIKKLAAHGAMHSARDRLGNTPMHIALSFGNMKAVEILLELNADISMANARGATSLDLATTPIDLMKLVAQYQDLATSLMIPAFMGRGVTPLMQSIISEASLQAVRSLLDAGALPDSATHIKVTPLHIAAFNNREDIARLLIERGATIDAVDARGNTPLHIASGLGNATLAAALVALGADAALLNARGESATELGENPNRTRVYQDYASDE